jgi:hypothetical protein
MTRMNLTLKLLRVLCELIHAMFRVLPMSLDIHMTCQHFDSQPRISCMLYGAVSKKSDLPGSDIIDKSDFGRDF